MSDFKDEICYLRRNIMKNCLLMKVVKIDVGFC
jgi:hypothetical protein